MKLRVHRLFAVFFSVLLISSSVGSAALLGSSSETIPHSDQDPSFDVGNFGFVTWVQEVVENSIGKSPSKEKQNKSRNGQSNDKRPEKENGRDKEKTGTDKTRKPEPEKTPKSRDSKEGTANAKKNNSVNRDTQNKSNGRFGPNEIERNPGRGTQTLPPGLARISSHPNWDINGLQVRNNSTHPNKPKPIVVPDNKSSARAYRDAAGHHIESATFQGDSDRKERLLADIEGTYDAHLDENRATTAAVFRHDHRIASSVQTDAPNASGALIAADRELAQQALADATRARTVLDDRNESYDRKAVDEQITEAENALTQAAHVQERSPRPVAAIEHYRQAWTAAQRALDIMDEGVEPQVDLATRNDFTHPETVDRTVNGTVFDVRPYELDVSFTVENENHQLEISETTAPVATLTFNETVTVEPQTLDNAAVTRVSITASDPGDDLADRGYDPEDQLDLHHEQSNSKTVGFDGDGLPDEYERQVVGTDPFDPYSNSTRTNRDESTTGLVDGLEDFDGDNVTTFYEFRSGTDPFNRDTDGDELFDDFEIRTDGLSPVHADTDGDGIPDAEEDLDSDRLTAFDEQDNKTSSEFADTDRDQLTDGEEVLEYGTDPITPDTDGDGLLDGEEVELGTAPTVADTDGDGVLDGNEMFTTETANESLNTSISVQGKGNAAKTVSAEPNIEPSLNNSVVVNVSASDIVHVEAKSEIESAAVTLDYEETAVSDESDLAVFTYDRSKQTFVKLDSDVDAEANTVTGTTETLGTFVAFEESKWAAQFEEPLPSNWSVSEDFSNPDGWTCKGENDPTCDTSGDGVTVGQGNAKSNSFTIASNDTNQTAGILCIPIGNDCILPTDSDGDGVIDYFDDCPNTAGSGSDGCPSSGGYDPTPPSDDPIADDPNEPIDDGEEVTNSTFGRSLTFRNAEEIVVEATVKGEAAGDRSEAMFVVVDEDLGVTDLFRVRGKGDDGTVSESKTARKDLSEYAGESVAFRLVALNDSTVTLESMRISYDSDGDGVADSVETGGIRTGTGETYYTDPYNPDTDGDGLSDGEEVGARTLYNYGKYFKIDSNPAKDDTDGDGLTDYEETEVWPELNQLSVDTDGDGFSDYDDPHPTEYDEENRFESDIGLFDDEGELVTNAAKGAVYGEYGIVKDKEGSQTIEYYGGWLGLAIAPVADAPFDTRDCLVWTDKTGENVLDCGGAAISIAGSAGTVGGAVLSATGVGAAISAGSFALDTTEDVSNAVIISVKFIRHDPMLAAATGKFLIVKSGGKVADAPRKIGTRLVKGKTITEFRKGVVEGQLVSAGLDGKTATTIAEVSVDSGTDYARVLKMTRQVDGFDSASQVEKRRIAKMLTRSDEGARLAEHYDSNTLIHIWKADVEDEALAATKETGKAAKINRLSDDLNVQTFRQVIKQGHVDEAADLVKTTEHGGSLLNAFDPQTQHKFLEFDVGDADGMRRSVAISVYESPGFDEMNAGVAARFTHAVTELDKHEVGGLAKFIDDGIASTETHLKQGRSNQFKGSVYEAIVVAERYDAENIDEIGATGYLTKGEDIEEELHVVEANGNINQEVIKADEQYEFDAIKNDDEIVLEMKSGKVDKQKMLEKLVRTRRYLEENKGVPADDLDERIVVIINSKDSKYISQPVIDTIEANGGKVVVESVYQT